MKAISTKTTIEKKKKSIYNSICKRKMFSIYTIGIDGLLMGVENKYFF